MNEPSQALQPYDPQPLAMSGPTLASAQQLLTLAVEKGATPEALEKLLALHERMKAAAAKEAFDAAMADFQARCPIIRKEKSGAKDYYKYAPLEHIVSQTRDLMRECGFSYKLTSEVEQGWVRAIIKVTHTAGHSELSEFKCPVDMNDKNAMTAPQRYGAAMTFSKRYAFANAFGILTADEDLDGRTQRPKPKIGPQGRREDPPATEPEPTKPSAPANTTAPAPAQSGGEAGELKRQIIDHVRAKFSLPLRGVSESPEFHAFQQHLWDEGILSDTEALATLSVARLRQLLAAMKENIK